MHKIKNLFLAGMFTMIPIAVTIWLIKSIFSFFDNALRNIIAGFLGFYIPGSGFLLTIVLIFLVGIFASNILGKKIIDYFDHIVSRIPLINMVYKAVKEISKTLSKKSKEGFSKVVFVEFPMEDIHSIGFITNDLVEADKTEKMAVFIPTTPNPTNGFLVYVDKEKVKELDITVEEGIKMVMSMGSVGNSVKTKNE